LIIKYEIKYGAITGAGICLWIIAEYLLGFHTDKMDVGEYSIYFVVLIPLITIYLGIKEKRDRQNKGVISFNYGVRTGLMISLIAAVITSLFIIFYFNFIDPKFFERGVQYQTQKLILKGKTNKEIAGQIENIRLTFSFVNQLLFAILGTVVTGFIISIVLSLILKRKTKTSV
jgi:hypothetical protein